MIGAEEKLKKGGGDNNDRKVNRSIQTCYFQTGQHDLDLTLIM